MRLTFLHFDLNDSMECLQVRDGRLQTSELLIHESGKNIPHAVTTSSYAALLRYHYTSSTAEQYQINEELGSGFVVMIETIRE